MNKQKMNLIIKTTDLTTGILETTSQIQITNTFLSLEIQYIFYTSGSTF